jgi:thiol-disulfide isomerase/thioredoxin
MQPIQRAAGTIALVYLAAVLGSCGDHGKKWGSTISGKLEGAAGKTLVLNHISDAGETPVDSVVAGDDGSFSLPNKTDQSDYYSLRLDQSNVIFLFLNGGENIEVTGKAGDLEDTYTISGSEECEQIRRLKRFDKYLSDSLFAVFKNQSAAMPEKRDSLIRLSQKTYMDRLEQHALQIIQLYPSSIISISVTRYINHLTPQNIALLDTLNSHLMARYPGNVYVKDFNATLEQLKFLPAGSMAPEISLPDTAGVMRKLSSFRGKVVLIDFWASWCGPCRQESPLIVALYEKYHDQGLEIYGVSLDERKDRWTQAIRADNRTWTDVSDLKRWDSEVSKAYHVNAIPFSVLVGRDGRIIDKGLHGQELEDKLKEVL